MTITLAFGIVLWGYLTITVLCAGLVYWVAQRDEEVMVQLDDCARLLGVSRGLGALLSCLLWPYALVMRLLRR